MFWLGWLGLFACSSPSLEGALLWEGSSQGNPPAGPISLEIEGGVLGGDVRLRVTGVTPGERVFVVQGEGSEPDATCFPGAGVCLDLLPPVTLVRRVRADGGGTASVRLPLPSDASWIGREVCFQGLTPAVGGVLTSTAECLTIGLDTDGDGVPDGSDPCPDDATDSCGTWIFGAYDGPGTEFDGSVSWNGSVSCDETCGVEGLFAVGAQWVCNAGSSTGEGCSPDIDGMWSDTWCTEQILSGVYVPGDNPACGGESMLEDFYWGTGSESFSYHAVACQCAAGPLCEDTDGDRVCDEDDLCPLDDLDDRDGDGVCDSDDMCPFDALDDRDGDGACDSEDPCPDDPLNECGSAGWFFGAYDGPGTEFDGSVSWNGSVSCDETCGSSGMFALGARWVCNAGSSTSEGCSPELDGAWSPDWCTEQIVLGEYIAGVNPACGGEPLLEDFYWGTGSESFSNHAIECQCGLEVLCTDTDGDRVCDEDDPCPMDEFDDRDGDGVCDSDDPCPYDDPDDRDGDGICDSVDLCPDDPEDDCGIGDWVFGSYEGPGTEFDGSESWNGSVSCADACSTSGLFSVGARWVCNAGSSTDEGCRPEIDGMWSDTWCTEQILSGVYVPGDNPACGGETMIDDFVLSTGSESFSYHAIECQCGESPLD